MRSPADHRRGRACVAACRYSFGQALRSFTNRFIALGYVSAKPGCEILMFGLSVMVLLRSLLSSPQHLRSSYLRLLGAVVGD